jgi:hypothetical protein
LYGRPVSLTSDDGKCEHVPLSKVTSYAGTTESLEARYTKIPLTVYDDNVDFDHIEDWILSNRNLVEDILKEGGK